jgi:alpha-tubulin suppressor-like RCC1 family protein
MVQMSSQPSLVTKLCDVTLVSVAAGSYHSAAVDDRGRLWTWGWGVHGQVSI